MIRRVLMAGLLIAGLAGCSPRQAKEEPVKVEAPPVEAPLPPVKPAVVAAAPVAPTVAAPPPVAPKDADAAQIADDAAAVGMTTREDAETPGGAASPAP